VKKTKTQKRKKQIEPLPFGLVGMSALIGYKDPDQLRGALAAARKMLAQVGDNEEVQREYEIFVMREAQFGPYRRQVLKAFAADPGNIEGDLFCALANPALLVGLAVAWLAWRDGCAR
jgi:hypothetical protein